MSLCAGLQSSDGLEVAIATDEQGDRSSVTPDPFQGLQRGDFYEKRTTTD
jgi:hypothetical protein